MHDGMSGRVHWYNEEVALPLLLVLTF